MPGEIITLQIGSYANYVGAHYWNLQDELLGLADAHGGRQLLATDIDFGALYREGLTASGKATYTPRLLAVDLRGCLGGINEELGGLHDGAERGAPAVTTWGGRVATHVQEPIPLSTFQEQLVTEQEVAEAQAGQVGNDWTGQADGAQLEAAARQLDTEGGVRYWTDYLKAELHPRSVLQLPGLWCGDAQFDGWGEGAGVARAEGCGEELLDRVRRYAEECDYLQGFQLFVEDCSGFGCLAADVARALREEYGAAPVMLWALRPSPPPRAESPSSTLAAANAAFSLAHLTEAASVYCPLNPPDAPSALPHIKSTHGRWFRSAALLAAALDSCSLPYRLDPSARGVALGKSTGAMDMRSLVQLLSQGRGCSLAAAALALPCALLPPSVVAVHEQHDVRTHTGEPSPPFTRQGVAGLTHGLPFPDSLTQAECIVLRGPRSSADAEPCTTSAAAATLDASLLHEGIRAVQHRVVCPQPLALPLPFPNIWGRAVRADGVVADSSGQHSERLGDVESSSVLTRMWASGAAHSYAEERLRRFKGVRRSAAGRALLGGWQMAGEEADEVEERLHALISEWDEDQSD